MPVVESVILSRFGFVVQVVTEGLPALCARKAIALVKRKRLQSRDIYDLSWFLSRRILPDTATLLQFGDLTPETLKLALLQTLSEANIHLPEYKRDLALFLIKPEQVERLGLLREMVEKSL